MDFFLELIEGFRSAGRKGGVVAVLLGAIILAGGLSFAREAMDDRRHRRRDVEPMLAAIGIVLGAGAILGGLGLIVTGGSSRSEPARRRVPSDPLESVPLPYSLCIQCPRVVKNWNAQTCTRCGGDLVYIQNEEDEQWAREELAARNRPVARRPAQKVVSRTSGRRR
jgi:hypothetical protein